MNADGAAGVDGDVAAGAGAVAVLGEDAAAGVQYDVAADGERHRTGGGVAGRVVVTVDGAVDDQISVHCEGAVDEMVLIVDGAIEGAEARGSGARHIRR